MKPFWLIAAVLALAVPQIARAEHVEPTPPPDGIEFLTASDPVTWKGTSLVAPSRLTEPTGTPHRGFVRGHCTSFVSQQRLIVFGGHAREWPKNAAKAGYRLSDAPLVGAVLVTRESKWGHVSIVRSFTEHTVTIEEQNYRGLGIVSTRTLARSDRRIVTFIL